MYFLPGWVMVYLFRGGCSLSTLSYMYTFGVVLWRISLLVHSFHFFRGFRTFATLCFRSLLQSVGVSLHLRRFETVRVKISLLWDIVQTYRFHRL